MAYAEEGATYHYSDDRNDVCEGKNQKSDYCIDLVDHFCSLKFILYVLFKYELIL